MTEVAVHYLADWGPVQWVLAGVALIAALTGAALAGSILSRDGDDDARPWLRARSERSAVAGRVAAWLVVLVSLVAVLILPGVVMRRLPEQWLAGVLALVLFAAALVFAWRAWRVQDSYGRSAWYESEVSRGWFYVPAGAVALGAVGGIVNDAANRFAASIPITTGAVFIGALLVGALMWAKAAERR